MSEQPQRSPSRGYVPGLACPRCGGPVAEDRVRATVHGGYVCLTDECPTYGIMKREVVRDG